MAQNITTLLDKNEITAADIRENESTIDNYIYVVHGSGSERDKKLNLKQLRAWLSLLTELTLVKAFTGGQSTMNLDGDGMNLSATGESVSDNSSMSLSRMGIEVQSSSEGGETHVSFDSGKIEVSYASSSLSYKWVLSKDGLKFYIGESNSASAEFSVDPSTGRITISCAEGIVCSGKIYATSDVEGDVYADNVNPTDVSHAVNIGSVTGGVNLAGPVIVSDKLKLNLIESYQAANPIEIKSIVKATNVPNDFVSVDSITNNDPASSRTLLVESAWTVGQVKRFLNTQSSDKVVWVYVDTSGGNRSITIPAHCFVTVACTGIYTNTYLDNEKFAVLAVEACNA